MPREEPDRDSIERRLAAVERALSSEEPVERRDRLDDLEDRVAELEVVEAVPPLYRFLRRQRALDGRQSALDRVPVGFLPGHGAVWSRPGT